MAVEPNPQRQPIELVDVAVDAKVREYLSKLRSSETSECLKTFEGQERTSKSVGFCNPLSMMQDLGVSQKTAFSA
jgi:hypothetical protein